MRCERLEELLNQQAYLAVVGLGYVGLPLAVAFADRVKTIGFDNNVEKIATYCQGIDPTQEVGDDKIRQTPLCFTADPGRLREARFIIVAVPTPINGDKTPDLTPVIEASRIVGQNLTAGSLVVFESTVYPGVTEDVCRPILEAESGLVCGRDFKIGYSPERINPGDRVHRLENICKIVSGMDAETTQAVAAVYELVITAGVHKASSIKVAEAAKLVENAQRDINIAFMNELSMVFDRMGINTQEVIDAMNTKWNALRFYPGLVGGHCIGVDPHYFIYQAQLLGYHSEIIAAGRKINEQMTTFVSDAVIKKMIQADKNVRRANVYIMGITFKEDCPDMRNSKAIEIYRQLAAYGVNAKIVDPVVAKREFEQHLDAELVSLADVRDADCLLFVVAHQAFKALQPADLAAMCKLAEASSPHVVIDVKSIFDPQTLREAGYIYWSL